MRPDPACSKAGDSRPSPQNQFSFLDGVGGAIRFPAMRSVEQLVTAGVVFP